ncbi:MAG: hypothetical protein VX641_07505 [Planctomycetota bacterium]|nr:hypothetical protein [Planctomycetota bacterium]
MYTHGMITQRLSWWTSRIIAPAMLAALSDPGMAQGNYITSDPYESSIAAISRGITVRRDGSNHNILLALRQLEDPRMRPLFQSLFASDEPSLRIDALLALAELEQGALDPFLLQQLAPKERQLALIAAISLDRFDENLIRGIRNFPDLGDSEKAVGIIMGIRLDLELDRASIDELLAARDPATRMVGAALLNDEVGDSGPLEVEIGNFSEMALPERIVVASALIDIASWHPMPGALAVLRMVANDDQFPRSLRLAAIDSAMGCDCELGLALWMEATRLAESSGDRSRLGVAAIERGLRTSDWSSISDERQLNQRLALAGASLEDGSDISDRTSELLKIRHPLSLQAALAIAEQTEDRDEAMEIRTMVLRSALDDSRFQPVAGRILRSIDAEYPKEIMQIIRDASFLENREILGEVMLTAILENNPPEAVRIAEFYEDHADRSLRSLAVLIKARAMPELDDEDLEELGLVASGGGRISKQTRAIAGWLWLSHNDRTEQAMMEIMGGS